MRRPSLAVRVFLFSLEKCWNRGMHVIISAHSQVKSFQNPEGPPFDRYEIAMNAKSAGLLASSAFLRAP